MPNGRVGRGAFIGDVICYDWEGDGRFNHNTIVTAYDADGQPLVNAHTQNSLHRRWEYRDSPPGHHRHAMCFPH